jgi:hypothetical protein
MDTVSLALFLVLTATKLGYAVSRRTRRRATGPTAARIAEPERWERPVVTLAA